jgi:hypothetical protein
MTPATHILLHLIDEAYDHMAWHGPTLRGALRGVTAAQASWRASAATHNIWELTVHAAYWKYAVRRLLTGEKRGSFALDGSNWFRRPVESPQAAGAALRLVREREWRADLQLLATEHRALKALLESLPEEAVSRRAAGKSYSAAFVIRGIAAHDLYHAGQVQLLKRLCPIR